MPQSMLIKLCRAVWDHSFRENGMIAQGPALHEAKYSGISAGEVIEISVYAGINEKFLCVSGFSSLLSIK